MVINQNSRVYLLKGVPLDTNYDHTIYFGNKTVQANYFMSKSKHVQNNLSYVRVNNNTIKVNITADDVYDCNYIMFQNQGFIENPKWWYAFIVEVNYINNVTCEIVYQLDVIQSFFFDFTLEESYVEREHPVSDTFGANLVPENLERGEYVLDSLNPTGWLNDDTKEIVVATTFKDTAELEPYEGTVLNGMYNAINYLDYPFTAEGVTAVNDLISRAVSAGKETGILSVFMCNKNVIDVAKAGSFTKIGYSVLLSDEIGFTNKIGNYTPKCKKVLTYPYNFVYVTNYNGVGAAFPYEFFKNNSPSFTLRCEPTPTAQIMLVPVGFKGVQYDNNDERITNQAYAQCAWSSSAYDSWLALNGTSMAVSNVTNALSGVVSIATGDFGGAMGAAGGIASNLASMYEHSLLPNQSHDSIQGGLAFVNNLCDFGLGRKHITEQMAKVIDDYFYCFGYATHRIKVPNTHSRPYWNYVKTIDVNITGSVPAREMQKICEIHNKGITYWKYNENLKIGDYSQDNTV